MKKILVPTDLSEIARQGLELAVEIAKRVNAEIYLINFINHPFGRTFSAMGEVDVDVDTEEDRFNLELLHSNLQMLHSLANHYAGNGVAIKTEIIDDELKDGVDEYLKVNDIDLVVMGTSGEENFKEHFTGNNTEQIISISHCPVISIRDGFNINNFSHIVLAVDIMLHSKIEPGIRILRDFAEHFNATIHLVHVCNPSVKMEKNIEEYFTEVAIMHKLKNFKVAILTGDNYIDRVREYAVQIDAGLLAVLKNNEDKIINLFKSHFSDELIKKAQRPVFTYTLQ